VNSKIKEREGERKERGNEGEMREGVESHNKTCACLLNSQSTGKEGGTKKRKIKKESERGGGRGGWACLQSA